MSRSKVDINELKELTEFRTTMKRIMKYQKITVHKLATECGIADNTIMNIYLGKNCPSLYTAAKIARGLGIPLSEMVDYDYDHDLEEHPEKEGKKYYD